MNYIDIGALIYIGLAFKRGMKRGLGKEVYKLINIGVAFATGAGLYGLVSKALTSLTQLAPKISGVLSYVGVFGGAMAVVRMLKSRIRSWVDGKFAAEGNRFAAGGIAAARALVVVYAVLIATVLAPSGPVRRHITEGSLLGRVIAAFAPAETQPASENTGTP